MRNFYRFFISSLTLLCLSTSADAVLLDISADGFPDVKSRNAINYYFTNGTDASGGFTMDIIGTALTIQTSPSGGNNGLSGDTNCYNKGCYDLTATFSSTGTFIGGTIDVTGESAADGLTSGVLVDATLTNFGWGGTDNAGLFQYTFSLDGGDFMTEFGGANGGTILDTRDLSVGAGHGGALLAIGDWDSNNLMTMEFSTFSGSRLNSNTTSDTFIPVPAAAWLFGSGLIALFGVARRRHD